MISICRPRPELQAPAEIDVAGRGDPLFAEIDVVGQHEQVVLVVRPLALAADRHRPAKPAFDQPPDAALVQVQRPVETQVRALRHFHHHGVAQPLDRVGRGLVGHEDDRQRLEIDPAVVVVLVVLPQQHDLAVAVDDLGVVKLPGAGREEDRQDRCLPAGRSVAAAVDRRLIGGGGGGSIHGTANSA